MATMPQLDYLRKFKLSQTPAERKSKLVDIGLQALNRGDRALVRTITKLIAKRGWGDV
jgi:hypothetical protein